MKYIYKTLSLALSLSVFSSCSDFLDQTAPSDMDSETLYNNAYYTSLALNKVYGSLTQDQTYSQWLPIIAGLNTDCELVDGLGDDANNTNHERGCMNYNCSPGWSQLSKVWDAMYGVVENANLVIEGVESSSLIDEDNEDRATMLRYRAEAKVLKAMVYLDLIRLFGDVPYKKEASASDLSNVYLPKTDRDVILDDLINDLEAVVADLPWVDEEGYTTEHVTRGYAHALIANMALTRSGWMIRESRKEGYIEATDGNSDPTYPTMRCDDETRAEMYKIAEKHLATIINSGRHSMNKSVEEYWRLMNICQLDPSHEAIFEIPMMLNKSSELGYTVGYRVSGASDFFGLKGNSTGKLKVTAPYFWSFDHSGKDLRRDITCALSELRTKDDVFGESMLGNKPFALYCGKWDYRKMAENQTWLEAVRAGDANAKICSGINVVKMRYPHVLLMYAEVVNENYGSQDAKGVDIDGAACGLSAYDALLSVHQRAYDDADKAQARTFIDEYIAENGFFNTIVQENAWELAGEGVRKFELIRWNLLSSKIQEFKDSYEENAIVLGGQEGGYPAKIYFKYKDKVDWKNGYREIDMGSVDWYAIYSKGPEGYESADFWGKEASDTKGQEQYTKNWPSISSGLNAVVKNRYLLPIASTTISTSNGSLSNSYGYSN